MEKSKKKRFYLQELKGSSELGLNYSYLISQMLKILFENSQFTWNNKKIYKRQI